MNPIFVVPALKPKIFSYFEAQKMKSYLANETKHLLHVETKN